MTTQSRSPEWRIRVDTGGTFTDCLAIDPSGRTHRVKVLSNSSLRGVVRGRSGPVRLSVDLAWDLPPEFLVGARCRRLASAGGVRVSGWDSTDRVLELERDPGPLVEGEAHEISFDVEAPVLAAHLVTGVAVGRRLPPIRMRLATTRGTNALLERRGAPLALFITRGFGDLLRIGTQQRPDLFAIDIRRPAPLYREVVEVEERLASDGSVLRRLNTGGLRRKAAALVEEGVEVAAVALAHSYRNPEHELRLGELLAESGFAHVSLSSELAPLAGLLARAETAVADAYLSPLVSDYLGAVAESLDGGSLHVMTSAGGLVRAAEYRACDSLLSGPAGGVVGASRAGREVGRSRAIAFDMGGTSTDVARIDGEFEYLFETRIGDVRLLAPTLAIETVAAGGGSVCSFDGGRLRVGPESSGADPGPACYGAGGPLSLTDVNLLLGRLDRRRFEIPIDSGAAERAAESLMEALRMAGEGTVEREDLLEGLLQIADERMADAIRTISVRRGYDPSDYTLVAFGGAGGQHACSVAELLGMGAVLIPTDASLLSAHGLGGASIERFRQRQVLDELPRVGSTKLETWFDALSDEAVEAVLREGVPREDVAVRRRLIGLRLKGQDTTLEVPFAGADSIAADFATVYRRIYGYPPGDRPIEVESLRVVASSLEPPVREAVAPAGSRPAVAKGECDAFFSGSWITVRWYDRGDLAAGCALPGPALIFERHSATTVLAGWELRVEPTGALLMTRSNEGEGAK